MAAAAAKRRTFTPPKTYNFKQLELLWIGAGGSHIAAPVAASIALAESGGNPNSENHNTNGSIDRGLWQINSVHGGLSTTGVVANAKAAVKVFDEAGKNFAPWVTFKTGAYKSFINQPGVDVEKAGAEGKGFISQAVEAGLGALGYGTGNPQAGKAAAGAVGGVIAGAEEKGEQALKDVVGFSWNALSKFAVTAGLLLLGLALMVYGIIVAVRPAGGGGLSFPRLPMPMPVPV